MNATRGIEFREGGLLVKTLCGEEEMVAAYRLRHRVFAQMLKWVPTSIDELEIDAYDGSATFLGLFCEAGKLVGLTRLLPAPGPYMLEKEFRCFLEPGYCLRKERDTTEITRLAIDPSLQDKGLSSRLMLTLFKGIYQWSLSNDIRYCYMVVERRFLRVLQVMGFPCEPMSHFLALPPAGALSVAAVLDWERFRIESAGEHPDFLEWISALTESETQEVLVASTAGESATKLDVSSSSFARRNEELVEV
ncbi:MAG: hypothetical protein C4293_02425 [Nitrospiraceae bacterium]